MRLSFWFEVWIVWCVVSFEIKGMIIWVRMKVILVYYWRYGEGVY